MGTTRHLGRAAVILAGIFFFPLLLLAQETFKPKIQPSLTVPRVSGEVKIDGTFDEPIWRQAVVADGFSETDPGDLIKPPVDSRALIAYDEHHLYVALIALDDPATIRYHLRDRDNIFRDDYFGIMLDTYGDASWGYELFVNPLGIQGDLRMHSDGNEDMTFDLIWESKGIVTDSGYQVEIAIPFASLRFPNKELQTWRANFWRDRQRDVRRRMSWSAISRDVPCFMCQWGTLTGISGIEAGSKLEILPNIIAFQSGQLRDYSDPDAGFENSDADAEISLNARYSVTSNSTAELSVNPDFSQVESDATQIDVNSPFALFYEERRPFFQEGSDLYGSFLDVIYTRSIADPDVATKLTGKFGRTSFAYLLGHDERTPLLVPQFERSYLWQGGKSISNIFRVKHQLSDGSFIGGMLTDRRLEGGGAGTVLGGDASYLFWKNYRIEGQVVASRTDEPNNPALSEGAGDTRFDDSAHTVAFDDETFWGHSAYFSFERDARIWNVNIDYIENSPTFRADNGFITRNANRTIDSWTGLNFQQNSKFLQRWEPSIDVGATWNWDGERVDEWLVPHIEAQFTGQTFIWAEYLWSKELFRDVWFPGIRRGTVGVSGTPIKEIMFEANGTIGRVIARSNELATPVLGESYDLYFWLGLKPTMRLVIEPYIEYSKLDFPDGGPNIYDYYVARSRFSYQLSREWFIRVVVEYVHGKEIVGTGGGYAYDEQAYLSIEPLLSYKLNPFTIFYVGSSHDYWDVNQEGKMYESSRRFFAKFQYLFRI
jgi:hypothetical protein